MTVAKASGFKAKCDKLFSRIIRFNGACENCDYVCPPECKSREDIHRLGCKLQCAHLITRHRIGTRCEIRNAFSLCAKCHHFFTNWPLEFSTFVLANRSEDEYRKLKALANNGPKIDWTAEYERLEREWGELRDSYDF